MKEQLWRGTKMIMPETSEEALLYMYIFLVLIVGTIVGAIL